MHDGDIDFDRCWLALKAVIVAKRSHGAKDLLAEMARIEVESTVPRSEPSPPPPGILTEARDGIQPIPLTAIGGTHGRPPRSTSSNLR